MPRHPLLLFGSASYTERLLALGPIALWPMDEGAGAVAVDRSGNGRDGAYTGITWGNQGPVPGSDAPLFDGVNDYVDIYSASLAAAFNGAEGTLIVWVKTPTWAAQYEAIYLGVDDNNYIQVEEYGADFRVIYVAGGTVNVISDGSKNGVIAFFPVALTWSKAGDAVKEYIDGIQVQSTSTGLGIWAGALAATRTCIGAANTTPILTWSGAISPCILFGRALTPAEIASASVV